MQEYQQAFLNYVTTNEILKFGDFTLKSGRKKSVFL